MLVPWLAALCLVAFARRATRVTTLIPDGPQNLLEWIVERLYHLLQQILEPALIKRTFWFFVSAFLFVLTMDCLNLVPGVDSVGWGVQTPSGFEVMRPVIRGTNADLN